MRAIDYWRQLTPTEQESLVKQTAEKLDSCMMAAIKETLADLKHKLPAEIDHYDFACLCIRDGLPPTSAYILDLKYIDNSIDRSIDGIPY